MNQKKVDIQEELNDNIYEHKKFGLTVLTFLGTCFTFGFLFNVSLTNVFQQWVTKKAQDSLPCRLDYEDVKFNLFFFPKVTFSKPNIAPCLGLGDEFILPNLRLEIRGPSLSPFGIKTRLSIFKNTPGDLVEANVSFSFGQIGLKLEKENLNLSDLLKDLGQSLPLQGMFNYLIDLRLNTNKQMLSGKIQVKANKLETAYLLVKGLELPPLKIGPTALNAHFKEANRLEVDELVLGSGNSPIYADFKGRVSLNLNAPPLSEIDLLGDLSFSTPFLESFAIIKLFLDRLPKDKDLYKAHITGNIAAPQMN